MSGTNRPLLSVQRQMNRKMFRHPWEKGAYPCNRGQCSLSDGNFSVVPFQQSQPSRRLQPRFLLGVHQVHLQPLSASWHCHRVCLKSYMEDDKISLHASLCKTSRELQTFWFGWPTPWLILAMDTVQGDDAALKKAAASGKLVLWPPEIFASVHLPMALKFLNSVSLQTFLMSPFSPPVPLSCLLLPVLLIIVLFCRCSGLLLTKTTLRQHSLPPALPTSW